MLSQWRGYSNNGFGISIGFNPSVLKVESTLSWEPIEYDSGKQDEYILENLKQVFSEDTLNIQDHKERSSKVFDYTFKVLDKMTSYKNPSFLEEKEFRLVHKSYIPFYLFKNLKFNDEEYNFGESPSFYKGEEFECFDFKPIDYQIKNSILVPYIDIGFEKIKNDFIRHIIIGPKCEMSVTEIRAFLHYNGFSIENENIRKIKVEKSSSTYR